MIVFRYVAAAFGLASAASMLAISAIYLVIDFVDRAKIYEGNGWLGAVVELYACKAISVTYQLAPAAVALGAAVALSSLRRTGEVTALRALGHGPATFLVPVAALSLVVAVGALLLEDPLVVPANYRAEEITVQRFHRFGDWAVYHQGKRWFRGDKGRIWYLGRPEGRGFSDVTLYEFDDRFSVTHRLDAALLQPTTDGRWTLTDVVERDFRSDGISRETRLDHDVRTFADDLQLFRVKTGRPSQLRRSELPGQVELRERLGLPSREFSLALHERRSYPFTSVPAGVLGASLALRRRRNGHLTAAIAEGVLVVLGIYALTAFARTATLGGHLGPVVGGWLALAIAGLAAAASVRLAR